MKFIAKYSIGLYLVVSLLFKLNFIIPHAFVNVLFYTLMAFGFLLVPFKFKMLFGRESLKTFWLLHLVNLLNLTYLIVFDLGNLNSILYFITRFAGFNLIIIGLTQNYDFYKTWFIKNLKYVMVVMILAGMIFGVQDEGDARLSIGFNANDVGLFGLYGLFAIITFNPKWQKNRIDILLLVFFLIVALLSGSKATLLGIALVAFLNFGVSFKSFGFALVFVLAAFVASKFGFTTGIDRLLGVEGAFDTRDDAFRNGMLTLFEQFWHGHGLERYCYTNPIYYDEPELALGPHNAYIAIGIMYGVAFGSVLILLLLRFLFQVRSSALKSKDSFIRFGYYFMVLVVINGFFEVLIVGLNEFMTITFWFFIGVTAICYSSNKKAIKSQRAVLTQEV